MIARRSSMRSFLSRLLAPATLATLLAFTSASALAEEGGIISMEVKPGARGAVDEAKLRARVGGELHVQIVQPEDAAAEHAKGALVIDVDDRTHELAVTYAAHTSPIARRVPLPRERSVVEDSVVLLAGNLARDEADELAASMRRKRSPAGEGASRGSSVQNNGASTKSADEVDHLRRVLEGDAERDRNADRVFGWTAVGLAVAATAASAAIETAGNDEVAFASGPSAPAFVFRAPSYGAGILGAVGALGMGFGVGALFVPSQYETLLKFDAQHGSREATEEEWRRMAQEERSRRTTSGVVSLAFAGVAAGIGTLLVADQALVSNVRSRAFGQSTSFTVAAATGILGGYLLATDGPLESGLHAYQETTGRGDPSAPSPSRAEGAPRASAISSIGFAAVPGSGGVATISGQF